jgi:hypothetical protein
MSTMKLIRNAKSIYRGRYNQPPLIGYSQHPTPSCLARLFTLTPHSSGLLKHRFMLDMIDSIT